MILAKRGPIFNQKDLASTNKADRNALHRMAEERLTESR
jgi:hypothetical protein